MKKKRKRKKNAAFHPKSVAWSARHDVAKQCMLKPAGIANWLHFVLINYMRYGGKYEDNNSIHGIGKKGTGNFNALFGIYLWDATTTHTQTELLTCVSGKRVK